MKKYLLQLSMFIILLQINLFSQTEAEGNFEVTFFVAADTHFDPPPESDQFYHTVAMNSVCGSIENIPASIWPKIINGNVTNFGSAGEKIDLPSGVVLAGDITDRADPKSLELFKTRYEKGKGDKVINFPVYVGLGNHDLDPQHVGDSASIYRNYMFNYIEVRHKGESAPVPVLNFDDKSRNYSWNWNGVHLIQTHRFAGNTENGQVNSIEWLNKDLEKHASNNKPVIIVQHYGFDPWSLEWSTLEERETLYETIKNFNIVAIFVGHNHIAEKLVWRGFDVFQVNNAWPDSDGNGSFAICKITNNYLDVVTCRWKNGEGDIEFIEPYFHKNINIK